MKNAGAEKELLASLNDFLGETFKLSNLHSYYTVILRKYAQKRQRLPNALKLTAASGRQFKLYTSDTAFRFAHMVERNVQARSLALFPEIIWQHKYGLLAEFIPGTEVQFSDADFARNLGQAMARLHKIEQKPANVDRIRSGTERDVKLLVQAGIIRGNSNAYIEILDSARPGDLLCSMDYADVKPGNFLNDKQGRLRFIDMGALRANRPSGQYICGSLYFRRLNRVAFQQGYEEASGLPQVLEQAAYLRMLHCIWSAALYVRKMRNVPYYLPMHRLGYWFLAKYLVIEFKKLARQSTSIFYEI